MKSDIAVFVASSDNTQDVLRQVFPSIRRYWPDCPFPVYVGKNSPEALPRGCIGVYAPASSWHGELLEQLRQVHASRVILLLDDFLFTAPVRSDRLNAVIEHAVRNECAYVRLKPLQRAALAALFRALASSLRRPEVEPIPRSTPYYSGLQPALWSVEHLRACLAIGGDIWSFEHIVDDATPHYAVRRKVLDCIHVVERGRWLPSAARLFSKAGLSFDPGGRQRWPKRTLVRIYFGALKFAVFGYTGIRLRRLARRMGFGAGNGEAEVPRLRATLGK
jgi:hypothetical protein